MEIIDLLNKIANKEEVPKKIKYGGVIYEYDENILDFREENNETYLLLHDQFDFIGSFLNRKVEIIEENNE